MWRHCRIERSVTLRCSALAWETSSCFAIKKFLFACKMHRSSDKLVAATSWFASCSKGATWVIRGPMSLTELCLHSLARPTERQYTKCLAKFFSYITKADVNTSSMLPQQQINNYLGHTRRIDAIPFFAGVRLGFITGTKWWPISVPHDLSNALFRFRIQQVNWTVRIVSIDWLTSLSWPQRCAIGAKLLNNATGTAPSHRVGELGTWLLRLVSRPRREMALRRGSRP